MAKRLYVGNLPYSTNESELKDMFAEAGTVSSATVITDKFSGRSKGFGFVEMSSDSEADAAVEKLNGRDIGGRKLTVNEARPREEGSAGGRGGFGGGRGFGGGYDRG
ncbi:MAG: RNA-binding protein [Candidatus Brennerbacteria bacterium]|nr:RNA-binding protein [Candidatus Brennerbacteria bacterium]